MNSDKKMKGKIDSFAIHQIPLKTFEQRLLRRRH